MTNVLTSPQFKHSQFSALAKELTSRIVGISLIGTSPAYQTGSFSICIWLSLLLHGYRRLAIEYNCCMLALLGYVYVRHCNIRPTVAALLIP